MTADVALVPSRALAGSGDPSPPLSLLVDGLGLDERSTLEAMLDLLAGKLPRPWVRVEGDEADLYLHARGLRRKGVRAGITALIVREEEPKGLVDELWVPVPFRVMAVLDLLNGAHDRLMRLQAVAPPDLARDAAPAEDGADAEPVPEALLAPGTKTPVPARPTEALAAPVEPAANDEKSLAFSLARLLVRPVEHSMRVRILGFGTLYVCPPSQTYRTDFDSARLGDALEAKRFVLTAISACTSELEGADRKARPIDELFWAIGLKTPRERHEGTPARVRLQRWPDFARLPHEPKHLQACALLTNSPLDLADLVQATGLDEGQADRFLHACELCGLLKTVVAAPPQATPKRASNSSSLGGLFDRLWGRLLK